MVNIQKKVYIVMINLKNSCFLLLVSLLFQLSCKSDSHSIRQNRLGQGYLDSEAYKKYLNGYKDDRTNSDYSTKRMFMLLGEESFMYSSQYDFYAIFCYYYKTRDTVDFFVVKSKDGIVSGTRKRLSNIKSFFYFDKVGGAITDSNVFSIAVETKVITKGKSDSVISLFDSATSILQPEDTYFPPYHAPIRAFYLL